MTLPAGYRFRPLEQPELRAIAAMFNEEAEALISEDIVPDDFAEIWWRQPDVDPDRDVVAVEAPDGHLAGAFLLRREPPGLEVWAAAGVALEDHGRGIGSAIVDEVERRARCTPSALRLQSATFDRPAPRALFEARGYRFVRRFLTMTIAFDRPPAPPDPVAGVRVSGYDPAVDYDAVYELLRTAFADHWGEPEWTREGWHESTHGRDAYDPTLWRLAWAGDALAGVLVGIVEPHHPELGHVSLLGVGPGYRRRGIGELLLRTAFVEFHARGLAGADLGVDEDSETGATRLYERAGMQGRPKFAVFEKELRKS